jgi:hypothetical protein
MEVSPPKKIGQVLAQLETEAQLLALSTQDRGPAMLLQSPTEHRRNHNHGGIEAEHS